MKRLTHSGLLLAVGLLAGLLLCACAAPGGQNNADNPPSVSDVSQNESEPRTIKGTVNQIDTEQTYLVLMTDEAYYRFDFSESGVDLSGFEPGDAVTVTYTGTLDEESEDITAELIGIAKN